MPPTLALAPRDVASRKDGDVWYLSSPLVLETPPARLGDLLRRAAAAHPTRDFLIERRAEGELRRVTYQEALRCAEGVADWLLRSQPEDARVLALSGNSIDHALLMLGCFLVGVPFIPVSPAYSLMSQDFLKLNAVASKVRPSVIYVESAQAFERATTALSRLGEPRHSTLLVGSASHATSHASTLSIGSLFKREVGREVREREATITPDHIAKILFTSGSTGFPKGVPNTHRMLSSNQQMIAQLWPFLSSMPLSIVDWLPWSHTFGGNHNFNMVLYHAGTLFVDEGKPAPALIDASIRNLKDAPPTLYFNVPAGFAALVPRLEADSALRDAFFSQLNVIFYAAAALPNDLWTRLIALARAAGRADNLFMTTAWGSTETSPLATSMHFEEERAGNIGLPAPGVTLKLVPNGKKLEVRVKGPNVMAEYFEEPELTKEAFDEEGFYKIGDAVKFARMSAFGDSESSTTPDPAGGLLFDGRVAEDFKLSSGTWVSVTNVRTGVVARAGGLLTDVVVCGQDRAELTLLAWPNVIACRALVNPSETTTTSDAETICTHEHVHARVREVIAAWNAENPASSTRISRILLLKDPPSIDAGEITDKGYINQRATLERRTADVARLYDTTITTDRSVVLAE